jgi:hypothetical protein
MSPVIYEFHIGHAINTNITQTPYGAYSIANLGYSSIQCQSVGLNMKTIVATCPYGKIMGLADDPSGPFEDPIVGPSYGLNPAAVSETEANSYKDACRR